MNTHMFLDLFSAGQGNGSVGHVSHGGYVLNEGSGVDLQRGSVGQHGRGVADERGIVRCSVGRLVVSDDALR